MGRCFGQGRHGLGLLALFYGMQRKRIALWAQIAALICLTVLAGPIGWAHYLLVVVMLLPAVFGALPIRAALLITGVTLAGFSLQLFDQLSAPGQKVIWIALLGVAWVFSLLLVMLFARTRHDHAQ